MPELTAIEIVGVVAEFGIALLIGVLLFCAGRRLLASKWLVDDQPQLELDRSHCRYCGHLIMDCRCDSE